MTVLQLVGTVCYRVPAAVGHGPSAGSLIHKGGVGGGHDREHKTVGQMEWS